MSIRTIGITELAKYNAACRALAEAKSVNEVLRIHDEARAMAACARIAKNLDMEADAVAIRLRATRQLDILRQAQAKTVGLNKGAAGGGKKAGPRGVLTTPRDMRPTLASQGIDKNLAKQARVLGALSPKEFEVVVSDTHAKVGRAVRNAVREVAIVQERAGYHQRVEQGGTVADLVALAASGYRAGVILVDAPLPHETYSQKGKQRSAERHYDTMSLDEIRALPVQALAAKDCALFLWGTWPLGNNDGEDDRTNAIHSFIKAWGFEYKSCAFVWVKTTPKAEVITLDGKGLHWGAGQSATRANTEFCLLATRGAPHRLAKDVHQIIVAPATEHSEKPEEARRRIERLFAGNYLELFARKEVPGWKVWGNEVEAETTVRAAGPADIPTFLDRRARS